MLEERNFILKEGTGVSGVNGENEEEPTCQVLECLEERGLGTCQFLYLLHLVAMVATSQRGCSIVRSVVSTA